MGSRRTVVAATLFAVAGIALVLGISRSTRPAPEASTAGTAALWGAQHLKGSTTLTGLVPLSVAGGAARYVGPHPASAEISLNFALPITDRAGLDALSAQEARTHRYLNRSDLYARFSPPSAQVAALQGWLQGHGFRVTHVGADRLALTATARTAQVERALHVKINDFVRPGHLIGKMKVDPYVFYANTTAPKVPANLGLLTISGLSDVDRFFTSVQLAQGGKQHKAVGGNPADCGDDEDAVVHPLCVTVRSGGYFPTDLRSLYDVTGHGFDGTGQTIGFTLWTAAERQSALTQFASTTGDQLITVDPNCIATGNSPTVPSSCTTQTVAADHLLFIMENGNLDNNFGSNVETALDVEAAHGVATHVAMKYYAAECSSTTPPGSGLANAGCNGSDVGLEDAIEDAANDPTLHTVSNSWAFGGEAEWGLQDPFLLTAENSFSLAAAAGTTFYFSTGDSGTYQSGYPSDSRYVVGVGGTSTYSTSNPGTWSTSTTWTGAGSWCSNIVPRPSWQTGPGVTANANCPGRSIPDVSAVSDPNTGVRFVSTRNADGSNPQAGQVGGTSLAAPVMNGLEADTENFVNAQTYGGPAPKLGFVGPVLYQLGNGGHASSYYRDIVCGNTANPTSGPDGDAAQPGWDAATGWGEPDWFQFATGYALALGATNLSVPSSLATGFGWGCAKTPGNSVERSISCPTSQTCYAVGNASGNTPWPGKFITGGAWGAVNTFFKSTDGGATFFPSNSDMLSIHCTGSSTCNEVGVGGRERRTTDGGNTWTDVSTGVDKPLTQITCPDSQTCYAAGDRGVMLKSTDGGQSWTRLSSTDGNPIYGLSCPSTSVCYATDIYGHVLKTVDGGGSFAWQQTPITTPGVNVPGSGGPNPFAGLMSISCSSVTTCAATGLYVVVAGQTIPNNDPPIVTTTNGGTTWTLRTSNAGTGNFLQGISCPASTTSCWAVGRGGAIVTTTDLVTWTPQTSGTTNMLNSVLCLSTSFCLAVGAGGTVDVYNGTTWTATTGNGGTGIIADVSCDGNLVCYTAGKQGVTMLTTTGGTAWTVQAGGGTTQQMNGVSCPSEGTCYAAGNAGTLLKTSSAGQTWSAQTSGTASNLTAISCTSNSACVAVGAAGTARYTTDGSAWNGGTTGTSNALNGVSCLAGACTAVGASGTIIVSADGGATWSPRTSGTSSALNAVTCVTGACYADGAGGTILKTVDGTTWTPQTSGTTVALNGISCFDASNCFAGGASGTVVTTTDGGATWHQKGNPLSGPVSALNATSLVLNGATCTASRCLMAGPAQGDVMGSPLLVVTVNASGVVGTTPNLTFPPSSPALSYSPSSEAGNVTGTLTCTTTATSSSSAGPYPISGCNGLDDPGFSVVYNYAGSVYTVGKASPGVSTNASAGGTIGASVSDTASLSGGFSPTGSITFKLYGPGDSSCSGSPVASPTVTVNGNGSYPSPSVTPAQAGTYLWVASYSGDGNNNAFASACNAANESVVIDQAGTFLHQQASPTVTTLGNTVSDSATLTAGHSPTGTITFKLYGPNAQSCGNQPAAFTATVTVNGTGTYSSPSFKPLLVGNYKWVATYSGDVNNTGSAAPCGGTSGSVQVNAKR